MQDTYERLLASTEEVLTKYANISPSIKHKGVRLASFILSQGELDVAKRKATFRDLIENYSGITPSDELLSTLANTAAVWHQTSTQTPIYYQSTSTGLPKFLDSTYTQMDPIFASPNLSEESETTKKNEQTGKEKTSEIVNDELSQTKITTQNLDTTVMAHLKQVTGLDEATLLPIATTITTVKIASPDISADELEAIIEDQVLVLEEKGYKIDSLNNPQDSPPQKSYSWEEVDEKIANSISKTDKYSSRSQTQIKNMVSTTRKGVESEIDKFAAESGISVRQRQRLEKNIKRDVVNYLDNTYAGLAPQEKEEAIGIGLKNFLLFEAAGKERLRREAGEPATLARHLANFDLNANSEALILQTIHAQAMAAGLNIDQARAFTQQAFPVVKNSYYFTGFYGRGLDPKKPTPAQKEAFLNLNKNIHTILAAKSPDPYPVPKNFNNAGFDLNRIHNSLVTAYGKPENMTKPEDYTTAQWFNAVQANFVNSLSPDFQSFANSFFNSPLGRSLVDKYQNLQGLSNMITSKTPIGKPQNLSGVLDYLRGGYKMDSLSHFSQMVTKGQNTPFYKAGNLAAKGLKTLGAKAWAKFAVTSLGKIVVREGAKLAAKTGIKAALATIGSAVPILGTIAGWVIGEVVTFIGEKTLGALKKLADSILGELGLSTDDLFKAGLVGGLAALALGSAGLGLVVGGGVLLGVGGLVAITTLVLAAIFLPIIITVLATPVVIAFILYIINTSAYMVPPSTHIFDPSGVLIPAPPFSPVISDPSGCPIDGGRILNYSYSPSLENVHGAHGTNYYWEHVIGDSNGDGVYIPTDDACRFSLPQGTGCRAPNVSTNVCYNLNSSNICTYYGYSIDITSPLGFSSQAPVKFPLVNGQSTSWNYVAGSCFRNGGTGGACTPGNPGPNGNSYSFISTTPDGIFFLRFTHMNEISNPASLNGSVSGRQIGTLYLQPGNTHLHLEVNLDSGWVKPENYFCN